MKNYLILVLFTLLSLRVGAQDAALSDEMLIQETFSGMFDVEAPLYLNQGVSNNPPPPVPVDGGLVALLAAGGGLAYRRYRRLRHSS